MPPEIPAPADVALHTRGDPHRRFRLSEVILGGQDGVVNVLGVVLGVAAATSSARIALTAGLAATFAESISMAAVAYTSTMADAQFYESERQREYRHVERVPALERSEIRELYRRKGFSGELLDRIVETITADKDVWVAVMLAEEHQLAPVSGARALRAAGIVGVSSLVGSFLPLLPFFFLAVRPAAWLSIALSAAALFAVGAYKARVTVGRPVRAGIELTAIGILSALIGYAIGAVLQVPPGS